MLKIYNGLLIQIFRSFVVDALSLTGPIIKRAIYDVFLDYGMNEEEVNEYVCIVTDRGTSMLSAVNEIESEACKAHLLNNVVQQIMKVPEVKDIVNQASSLVKYMKVSHAASQLTYKLKSYPETRFNYAIETLMSIHDNYTEVFNVLQAKEDISRNNRGLTEKITCLPIEKLKEISDFLQFFKDATTAIEGDKYVTMHKVWPILRALWAKLQPNETDSDLIAAMKEAGLNYIQKTENSRYFNPSLRHKLALFLHPMMNRLQFLGFRGN